MAIMAAAKMKNIMASAINNGGISGMRNDMCDNVQAYGSCMTTMPLMKKKKSSGSEGSWRRKAIIGVMKIWRSSDNRKAISIVNGSEHGVWHRQYQAKAS